MEVILGLKERFSFIQKLIHMNIEVYAVGGVVRDYFLNHPITDFDIIARGLCFDDLVLILKKIGRVNLVGKSFGIIKFRPKEQRDLEIDIALPRKEISTGIEHKSFDVHFDGFLPIEQDLGRRDFTINAMAVNLQTHQLIDPFNGYNDLQNRVLKITFTQSFYEDPLRILRGVQFLARFKLKVERETFKEMIKNVHYLDSIASERITEELIKLNSKADYPSLGWQLIKDIRALALLFPYTEEYYSTHTKLWENHLNMMDHLKKDFILRLSALLIQDNPLDAKPISMIMNQVEKVLSLSNKEKERLVKILKYWKIAYPSLNNGRTIRYWINEVRPTFIKDVLELFQEYLKVNNMDSNDFQNFKTKVLSELDRNIYDIKHLQIKGEDLIKIGIKPSPKMGDILKGLHNKVLDNPEANTKDYLLDMARSIASLVKNDE